jgi:hypothetical protein
MICPSCRNETSDTARFCKHCGEPVAQERPAAPAAVLQETPAPSAPVCSKCGVALRPNIKFCADCGTPVVQSQAPPELVWQQPSVGSQRGPSQVVRRSPNRSTGVSVPVPLSSAMKSLSKGGRFAAAGGAAAFLGCLLPVESRSGMESAILPAIFKAMQYSQDAAILLVLPLSAVAIVVLTLCATSGSADRRAMLGGTTIAVGSPWAVVSLLALFAANKLVSTLGGYGLGGGVGIGTILLAVGFTVSVVGSFMILNEAVLAARHEANEVGGGSL